MNCFRKHNTENKITAQKKMVIETKTSIRYSKTSKKEKNFKTFD